MERLDTLVARVLADARRAMEERAGGRGYSRPAPPGELAEVGGGGEAPRLAMGRAAGRGAHGSHQIAAENKPKTPALNAAVRR